MIFGQKFAKFNKILYLCAVFTAAMVESVDTKDLKSFGPKRLCGFKSPSRYCKRKNRQDQPILPVLL